MKDHPLRVLIAEDEPIVLMELAEHFRDEGFEVIEAQSGEQALQEITEADEFDAAFTDIRLGGAVDGWDVADACRNRWPDIAVLYGSADPTGFPRPVGSSRYFSKPYEVEDVAKVCRLMCGVDAHPYSSDSPHAHGPR